MSGPVSLMKANIGRFGMSARASIRRINDGFKGTARTLRRGVISALIPLALMGVAMGDIVKTGAEFDRTIVSATSKFPGMARASAEEFSVLNKELSEFARAQAKITEFDPQQSARSLDVLAKAGFTSVEAMGALPTVMNLATVGHMSLAEAADISVKSMGALGFASGTVEERMVGLKRSIDILGFTSISSATSIQDVFESVKQAGAVANLAGQDIETLTSLIGVMGNSALIGSQSGRMLKRIFASIQGTGNQSGNVLKAFKINTVNLDGSVRDAVDVLHEFFEVLDTKAPGKQLGFLVNMFGQIAAPGAAVIRQGVERIRELRRRTETESEGLISILASKNRDTVAGDLDRVASAWQNLKLTLFESEKGPLRGLLQDLTTFINSQDEKISDQGGFGILTWAVENREGIKATATAVTALGVGFVGLFAVSATLNAVSNIFGFLMAAKLHIFIQTAAEAAGALFGTSFLAAVAVSLLPLAGMLTTALVAREVINARALSGAKVSERNALQRLRGFASESTTLGDSKLSKTLREEGQFLGSSKNPNLLDHVGPSEGGSAPLSDFDRSAAPSSIVTQDKNELTIKLEVTGSGKDAVTNVSFGSSEGLTIAPSGGM